MAPEDPPPDDAAAGTLEERIRDRAPLRFDEFVDLALYDADGGFYTAAGGRAGRRAGDFLTSPEVGPLFGVLVGRALDGAWEALGRPDPFVVLECGAGPGTLAVSVRAAAPRCSPALTWVLVERTGHQRHLHAERLELRPLAEVLAPAAGGTGPRFASTDVLPGGPVTGVVLANELLDNLAFRILERTPEGWGELWVEGAEPGGLTTTLRAVDRPTADLAQRWAPDVPVGGRIPVQDAARAWLEEALGALAAGRVLVLDYADTTAAMGERPWTDWVRTYRSQGRGGHPLEAPGTQDITCQVATDQLAEVAPPTVVATQAELLAGLGIDELVEEGRRTWEERAHLGDLTAIRARSRIREAEALVDPHGMGAFQALRWDVPGAAPATG